HVACGLCGAGARLGLSPLSLEEVLKCYEQPLNEEQAWALCFQGCRAAAAAPVAPAPLRTADIRLRADGSLRLPAPPHAPPPHSEAGGDGSWRRGVAAWPRPHWAGTLRGHRVPSVPGAEQTPGCIRCLRAQDRDTHRHGTCPWQLARRGHTGCTGPAWEWPHALP
uniref:Uncharacterized protein n=1 Tax=Geospiza parvula TaxID=87175 RepID=A0A8U8AK21_GEOPR